VLSRFLPKNTLISFSLRRDVDEKKGKKDKSRKWMSNSPSSSAIATQSQQFSKSTPILPKLEDESLPETITSLIGTRFFKSRLISLNNATIHLTFHKKTVS
jgi:hypothetical protein